MYKCDVLIHKAYYPEALESFRNIEWIISGTRPACYAAILVLNLPQVEDCAITNHSMLLLCNMRRRKSGL